MEKRTVPKQTKNADRIMTLKKNQKVPRITHETLSPRVIGVIKKRIIINIFAPKRSDPRFSTIQLPKKNVRVISGETKVISWSKRYKPMPTRVPNIDS